MNFKIETDRINLSDVHVKYKGMLLRVDFTRWAAYNITETELQTVFQSGGTMGVIDVMTKEYTSDHVVFSDLFNLSCFGGEPVIKPEQVKEMDTALVDILMNEKEDPEELQVKELVKKGKKRNDKKQPAVGVIEKHRDVFKGIHFQDGECCVRLLAGLENQTNVHYAMPVRNLFYDALSYNKQLQIIRKEHGEQKDIYPTTEEFLSRFLKTDRLVPVITMVWNCSSAEWSGPTTLHEMIDWTGIGNEIKKMIPDYRIHVIDPYKIPDEQIDKLKSEIKYVLGFMKYSAEKEKLSEYMECHEGYHKVSMETASVISKVCNINFEIETEEGGEVNMCKAIEDMKTEAMELGIQQGVQQGVQRGTELKLITLICRKLQMGKSSKVITDELEEEFEVVEKICKVAKRYAPEYDCEKIYEQLQSELM